MAKSLQIGSETYNYPEPGDNPGWGEGATDWAEAVTDQLSTLSGANDILTTTSAILDNQSSAQNIQGLLFSSAAVKSFEVTYVVERSDGSTTIVETGSMRGVYNGTAWEFGVNAVGDAGMDYSITAAGQVQYYSTSVGGTYTGSIKFNAKTIDV
jgi:hypothetical protein